MSRELPILFNTEMVRAILDGRKTVTRRIAKNITLFCEDEDRYFNVFQCGEWKGPVIEDFVTHYAPYKIGDTLYVRETWNICNMDIENNSITFIYKADESEEKSARTVLVSEESYDKYDMKMAEDNPEWRPSIHMPKEAARIWLKVTDVRVERLQDITEEQIKSEGTPYDSEDYGQWKRGNICTHNAETYLRGCFIRLWDSTIKKTNRDRYGWNANPYVWVVEFERCEKTDSDAL